MKRSYIFTILAVLLMAVIAFLFFYPDAMEGKVLQQHDIQQGLANGQEGKAFTETTGETTRWTNSLFGGMPNFQISPSYPSSDLISWITKLYGLGLPSPANLLFMMMVGFFIMLLCMRMKWYTALLGAIGWGFSTYFIIIIGAGHIWKFVTLTFIPPTIGGIILCYRGRYVAGTALASLFGALQLQANHPQMSYYFLFVIFFMVLAYLWSALKEKSVRRWAIATGCVVAAGVLGVVANSPSLYNTYEYSKETIRGRKTEIVSADAAAMSATDLFVAYGRPIGIGGIAMAGLIGIIRQAGIIKDAAKLAVNELGGKKSAEVTARTERDITMKTILTIIIATLVATLVFFQFGVLGNWMQTIVALLIVFVIAFLFTTVAANAIAIVGSNPVSGMTLMTLILSSLVLVSIGLNGNIGMTAALIIGGVVCTALSMAGGFITDLKIGYWLGTTPAVQQKWKFLGTIVSAATVAGVMIILNKTYGFTGENALAAPQANAMAAVIRPLMEGGQTPWVLYFAGAILALVLTWIGVPALAFSLGMFIPMSLNAPLVVGGLIAWYVSSRTKDEALNKARFDRGTLIASGFIAGGALMGVVSAILKFAGVELFAADWAASSAAEWTALAMYIAIMVYFTVHTMKAKKEE